MSKAKRTSIEVQGGTVTVLSQNQQDIFCLTDIAKFKNPDHPDDVIRNWLRTRSTVEFLGVWERLNNPSFNPVEFDGIITKAQTALVYAKKPTCSTSPSSARPRSNGAMPIPMPRATSATTRRWSSLSCSPISKASTPSSSVKACPSPSVSPSPKCAPSFPPTLSNA